jgi:prephenate dehydrogenase
LIGTSVALAATAAGARVWLHDRDPGESELAASRGAGEVGLPQTAPDLVVVAVPPQATAPVIHTLSSRYLKSTFTDVASIKNEVLVEIETLGGNFGRYVPGHPLAGGEVSGAAAARADLFADRVWVLTPPPGADPVRVEQVTDFVSALGAVVVRWDAEAHDRAVALTSHLPQVVSSLLAARLAAPGAADPGLSGQGLRDMTRIAASDPEMWTQILAANARPVLEVLGAFEQDLARLRAALQTLASGGDTAGARSVVSDLLARGNLGRELVPGKHGAAPAPTSTVVVAVDDRPGELGRLFAEVGATGCNLEDVRIDHALGRPTGLVELTVSADLRESLIVSLRSAGWDVRE